MYVLQLTGTSLEPSIHDEQAILQLLCDAATGKDVLLVIDDAWESGQVKALACLDTAARSAMLVTTRIQQLVPGKNFPIGVLPPETAVALLLEVSNTPKKSPPPNRTTDPLLFQAVEECGHLPLAIAVAGSMLEQLGGTVDTAFLRLLTEDRGEIIREGEFGDEHVALEDRIITSSLASYSGAERESVVSLFYTFAIFPEDVPVPAALFDRFATSLFGASGKRPWLQVRSWLTALMRLSLLNGSLQDGMFMHDIVRDFSISRCADLCGLHRKFLNAVLEVTEPTGWPEPSKAGRANLDWYAIYS